MREHILNFNKPGYYYVYKKHNDGTIAGIDFGYGTVNCFLKSDRIDKFSASELEMKMYRTIIETLYNREDTKH